MISKSPNMKNALICAYRKTLKRLRENFFPFWAWRRNDFDLSKATITSQ